jgi:hypothetical protein
VIIGPDKWYTIGRLIDDAVNIALPSKVDRHGMVPGAIAWDKCDCGMLAVSVGQSYLSDNFPDPAEGITGNCDAAWEAAQFNIQVIRCAPQPPDGELYPSAKALDTAAHIMAQDQTSVMKAVTAMLCGLRDDQQIIEYIAGTVDPQGPEGGCVGVQLQVIVCLPRA